jgi:protein involved in polysaccharide export with SLBB domain
MTSLVRNVVLALCLMVSSSLAAAEEEEYRIGADDVLHVIVWDNKDLEQTVVVRPDGRISFPLAGEISVQGLTPSQLADILKDRLAKSVKVPNVSVIVKEIRSFRVHFLGRVAKPGPHPIKAGTPLLHALSLAGGTAEGADLSAAYVIRGGQKIPVDLRRLIHEGDLARNIPLEIEDTIVVPEIAIGVNPQEMLDRRMYVVGKVVRPGVYTIKRDVPLLHALFLAGGVAEGADLAAAFVARGSEKVPVNLWKLIQKGDLSQNITVTHEDMVVIPAGGELRNTVYVMGEVAKPGVYNNAETLDLLKLVSLAGGFTKFAAPQRATLVRTDGDAKQIIKVDLKELMNNPASDGDPGLRPGDVLIVPERLF